MALNIMTPVERDMSKCNDLMNAINNSCKRLTRCEDGSIFPLNQEGGVSSEEINSDVYDCMSYFDDQVEDPTVPWVFTEKFKKDIVDKVYTDAIPSLKTNADDALVAFCRSLIPGLPTVRRTLRQMLAEMNVDALQEGQISAFFDVQCTNPMCAAKAFVSPTEDPDTFPPPNVAHPRWIYDSTSCEDYLTKMVLYIKEFVAKPISKRCSACNLFFRLTEGEEPVDLFGLPEKFIVNDSICSLYGMYSINAGPDFFYDLQIARVPTDTPSLNDDYVVYLGDRTFF